MKVNIETQYACVENDRLRGIPLYVVNLVKALSSSKRNGYSITFFDQYRERGNLNYIHNYIGLDALQNIQVFECNDISYRTLHKNEDEIYKAKTYNTITGTHADVYHFPHYKPIPYKLNGKMVVTIHDITPILPKAELWFTKEFQRDAAIDLNQSLRFLERNPEHLIITDSNASKLDILSYSNISQDQVFVVPLAHDGNIVDNEKCSTILKTMKISNPFLLYLGELDFRKGVVDILDAFEIVKPSFPDIKLVLAGLLKPSTSTIHEKLQNYRYINDVYLPGYVTNDQKHALLSSADIFLFPSEYEGFGLPVLEAMAHGTPVITTNVSSLPEVGGDAVIYVSPNNPEQLAYEIERVINDESLKQDYSIKAVMQSNKFSWGRTACMTEEVYAEALNRKK